MDYIKEKKDSGFLEGIFYLEGEVLFFCIFFFVIVLCMIIGSFMVCVVNIKNKIMFRSFYNVNIFYLVIIDLLVLFVIFLILGFIFEDIFFVFEGRISGEIFCCFI